MVTEASWDILGLEPTGDPAAVRRAYAKKLRTTRPEDDPEAFQRLRAAYEAALELTARGAPPLPQVAASSGLRLASLDVPWTIQGQSHFTAPAVAERDALQEALDCLTRALRPAARVGDIPLQRLLARVLDLALQGSLDAQRDAETGLARLLLSGAGRSDQLLEECVRRLGWERQERALSPDPLVLAVLARRRDVATLAALRSGQHPLAGAFAQLVRPASPLARWWRAHLSLARRRPVLQLLDLLEQHHNLLPELEAGEVAWWRRFESGPKLSGLMLGAGVAFIPWLMLAHAARLLQRHSWWDLWQVMCWPAGLAVLLVARLYLLDWPAWLIGRHAGRLPVLALAGWLPLLLALCAAAFAVRGIAASPMPVAVAGLTGCLWAIYVSGPAACARQGLQLTPGSSGLLRVLLLTPVPALWCSLALQDLTWPPHFTGLEDGRWVAAVSLMSAAAIGSPALQVLWTSRLSAGQRRFLLALLCAAAPCAGAMLVLVAGPWRPLVVWLQLAFLVVHRIALLDLPAAQDRARWLYLLAALAPMLPAAMASDVTVTDVVFGLGLALVVSAFLHLCMAFKGLVRRPARAE